MATLSGTTKDSSGTLAQKLVRVYRRDTGVLVASTLSNSGTGAWSVTTADTSEHFALMHDAVGDPFYDKTVASLPLTTNLVDSRGHTFTAAGNAAISGGALALDGSGDYLTSTSTDFDLASNDWTIEAFVRPTDLSTNRTICGKRNTYNADISYAFYVFSTGAVGLDVSSNGTTATNASSATGAVVTNTWTHVAAEKYGGQLKIYVDGNQSGSAVAFSSAVYTNTQALLIGSMKYAGSPDLFFQGSIKGFRITNGVARYKGSFTAPTVPYQESISGGTQNAVIFDRLIPV